MPIRNKWQPFKKVFLQELPKGETGVYEVGKAEGDIVSYIGKSDACIRQRLLIHRAESRFNGCTHFRKRITDPNDAQKIEKQLLKQYLKRHNKLPRINKIMSPGDPWESILY